MIQQGKQLQTLGLTTPMGARKGSLVKQLQVAFCSTQLRAPVDAKHTWVLVLSSGCKGAAADSGAYKH